MRFLTYNIRHGEGVDGWVSNRRIARVVESVDADVVGLNEVWHIRGLWDQPRELAKYLDMDHSFEANHVRWVHSLGNMVLARSGLMSGASNLVLPGGFERRGALIADIEHQGTAMMFVSAHLSLGRRTRTRQIEFLAETLPRDIPLVLAGDLNCLAEELTASCRGADGRRVSAEQFPERASKPRARPLRVQPPLEARGARSRAEPSQRPPAGVCGPYAALGER